MQSTASHINPELIRSYDLRGVVGRQLGLGDARQLGLAFAHWARVRGLRRIVVGRDGSLSSPELERALVEGLVAGGMLVHRIGLGPTPQLHFAVEPSSRPLGRRQPAGAAGDGGCARGGCRRCVRWRRRPSGSGR